MTDEEREKLAVELDADLQAFVAEKIAENEGKPPRSSVMDQTPEELADVCTFFKIEANVTLYQLEKNVYVYRMCSDFTVYNYYII